MSSLIRFTRTIVAAQRQVPTLARAMSDGIYDKEHQVEKDFVTRQERDMLKKLLIKMENDADPGHKRTIAALETKFSGKGVKLTDELKKELLAWRTTSH